MTKSLLQCKSISKIEEATNGQEAYEMVKASHHKIDSSKYDIIILDLNMPILNGYEACQNIISFYERLQETSKMGKPS